MAPTYEPHWPWTLEEHFQNLWHTADETLADKRPGISLAVRVQDGVKHMRIARDLEVHNAMVKALEYANTLTTGLPIHIPEAMLILEGK